MPPGLGAIEIGFRFSPHPIEFESASADRQAINGQNL